MKNEPRVKMPKRLTKAEEAVLLDILKAATLAPCSHPDCDPKQPSCASNYIFLRAKDAVTAAFRYGRGELVAVAEGSTP